MGLACCGFVVLWGDVVCEYWFGGGLDGWCNSRLLEFGVPLGFRWLVLDFVVWGGWYVGGFGCCVWFVLVGFGFCRGVAWRCFPFVGLVCYLV